MSDDKYKNSVANLFNILDDYDKLYNFKDNIFNLFKSRDDVIAEYVEYKKDDELKKGYFPICANKFTDNCLIRKGSQAPCKNCPIKVYQPIDNNYHPFQHIHGNKIYGFYPLRKDNTTYLAAFDFDNHDGKLNDGQIVEQVNKFIEQLDIINFPHEILRSKSGNGFHIYVFFEEPIEAYRVRNLFKIIIVKANLDNRIFDRMFPCQGALKDDGLGNLIAMPFQGVAAQYGFTLFLNPETFEPYPPEEQLEILNNPSKLSLSDFNKVYETIDTVIKNNNLSNNFFTETSEDYHNYKVYQNQDYEDTYEFHIDKDDLNECEFLKHCYEHPESIKEPLWLAMIANIVPLRPFGILLAHEYSARDSKRYNKKDCQEKINHVLENIRPTTCQKIKEYGFECPNLTDCPFNAPISLIVNNAFDNDNVEKDYIPTAEYLFNNNEEFNDDIIINELPGGIENIALDSTNMELCSADNIIKLVDNPNIPTIINQALPQFPLEVFTGITRDFIDEYIQMFQTDPKILGMVFMTVMGHIVSDKITLYHALLPQSRIYLNIVGASAKARKSTGARAVLECFRKYFPDYVNIVEGFNSGEAIAMKFHSPTNEVKRILDYEDELQAFINKSAINGSSLMEQVCKLFDGNYCGRQVADKQSSCSNNNSHFSFISCCTEKTYITLWRSRDINVGALNRFVILYADNPIIVQSNKILPDQRLINNIKKIIDPIFHSPSMIHLPFNAKARKLYEIYQNFINEEDLTARLPTYLLRFSILFAICDSKSNVDYDCVERAIKLCEYQKYIRKFFEPVDGITEKIRLKNTILKTIQNYPNISNRELKIRLNYKRYGELWDTMFKYLIKKKEILEVSTKRANSKGYIINDNKNDISENMKPFLIPEIDKI